MGRNLEKQQVEPEGQGGPLFIEPRGTLASTKTIRPRLTDEKLVGVQYTLFQGRLRELEEPFTKASKDIRGERGAKPAFFAWLNATEEVANFVTSLHDLSDEATHVRHQALTVHSGGAQLNLRSKSDKLLEVFERNGKSVREYLSGYNFLLAGAVDIRVGEVSLYDFYNQDRNQQLPVSSILRFFVEIRKVDAAEIPENFYEDNNSGIGRDYSQMLLANLERAQDIAGSVVNGAFNYKELHEYPAVSRQFPQSAPATLKLLEKTREFNARLRDVITDPENPEFEATKEVVQKYMDAKPKLRNYLVHLLAFAEKEALQDLYRKTKVLTSGSQGAFYTQFSDMLLGYAEEISDFAQFYSQDDLEEIFHADGTIFTANVPTIEDFRQQIVGIIPNKPKDVNEFVIDEETINEIDWGTIIPPQSAKIVFSKTQPMDFRVDFIYENTVEEDTVERTTVSLDIDARKGKFRFDWNFIEDPEFAEMKGFSDASKLAARQLLGKLSESLAAAKVAKKTARLAQEEAKASMQSAKLVAPSGEAIKSSPAQRRQKHGDRNPMEAVEEAARVEELGIKRVILIPEEQEMEDMMRQLSAADRIKVREGIEAFNERGVGGFKMLSADPQHGRLFILRINTGSKGIRVLLREGGKDDTQSKYEIVDIKRRKDIYRGKNNPWGSGFKLRPGLT